MIMLLLEADKHEKQLVQSLLSGETMVDPARLSTLEALGSCAGQSKANPAAIKVEQRIRWYYMKSMKPQPPLRNVGRRKDTWVDDAAGRTASLSGFGPASSNFECTGASAERKLPARITQHVTYREIKYPLFDIRPKPTASE